MIHTTSVVLRELRLPTIPQQTWAENREGVVVPLFGERQLGPQLTQCRWAEAYLPTE